MSPCTAKLSSYKNRRFLKYVPPPPKKNIIGLWVVVDGAVRAKPQSLLFAKSKVGTDGEGEGEVGKEEKKDGDGDVEMGGQ
jgi:Spo12 family